MTKVVNKFQLSLKQLVANKKKLSEIPVNDVDKNEERITLIDEIKKLKTKIYDPEQLANEIKTYISEFYANGKTIDIKDDLPLPQQICVQITDAPNSSEKDLQLFKLSR